MSGANARYTVVPTVTVLAIMKTRLVAATKGHALLKKKADALNMRFRQVQHCHLKTVSCLPSITILYLVYVPIARVRGREIAVSDAMLLDLETVCFQTPLIVYHDQYPYLFSEIMSVLIAW